MTTPGTMAPGSTGNWTIDVPDAPGIHQEPPLTYQWLSPDQGALTGMHDNLINMILEVVVNAMQGFVNFGESLYDQLVAFVETIPLIGPLVKALTGILNGTLDTLVEWTKNIPIIGDIVRAITQFFDPDVPVGLDFLSNWFTDLLGLFGNPLGLGSGDPTTGPMSDIPFFGPLFDTFLGFVEPIFGGVFAGNPLDFFFNILNDVFGLLGDPLHLGSGAPAIGSAGSIPILGPLSSLFQGLIDAILSAIEGIPIIGGVISDVFGSVTGLTNTSNNAHSGVTGLISNLLNIPAMVIGSLFNNVVDLGGGTMQGLLGGIFAGNQPFNRPAGRAGGTGGGTSIDPPLPGAAANGRNGYASMQAANYQAYQQTGQSDQTAANGASGTVASPYHAGWW